MKNHTTFNRVFAYVLVVLLCPLYLFAQTVEEKYDLAFQQVQKCGCKWIKHSFCCSFSADTVARRGERCPLDISYTPTRPVNERMSFLMAQTILLPEYLQGKTCRISLECMAQDVSNFQFIVSTLDRNEDVAQSDTLLINEMKWGTKALLLSLNCAKAIEIRLKYMGTRELKQRICLRKIAIEIDGKDVAQKQFLSPASADSIRLLRSFDRSRMQLLSDTDEIRVLDNIPGFEDKKIIGLGGFSLGSHEVNKAMIQFSKRLVTHHHTKLILLEFPFDRSILYDLYVQGLISADFEKNIIKSLQAAFVDYQMYMDFFNWLRRYNETATRKVHILGAGIDALPSSNTLIYEYFDALFGEVAGRYPLELIRKKRNQKLVEYAKADSVLKSRLNEDNYKLLLYFLNSSTVFNRGLSGYTSGKVRSSAVMINHLLNIPKFFLREKEKCVVLAHHSQLAKRPSLLNSEGTLGNMLDFSDKDQKRNSYFAISFQAGKGCITQRWSGVEDVPGINTLPLAPCNSFEGVALVAGGDYFYYPTTYLSHDLLQMLSTSKLCDTNSFYLFASPKQRFDALVFIRESTPIRNVNAEIK